MCQFLLEAGADKEITDDDGVTPADRAMMNKPPWPVTASEIQVFKFPERPPSELIEFWLEMDEKLRLGIKDEGEDEEEEEEPPPPPPKKKGLFW